MELSWLCSSFYCIIPNSWYPFPLVENATRRKASEQLFGPALLGSTLIGQLQTVTGYRSCSSLLIVGSISDSPAGLEDLKSTKTKIHQERRYKSSSVPVKVILNLVRFNQEAFLYPYLNIRKAEYVLHSIISCFLYAVCWSPTAEWHKGG